MPSFELGLKPLEPVKDTRICAFQHTHVHVSELFPKVCMLTYDFEEYRYSEMLLLLKMIIGLGENPVWLNQENMTDYSAQNIPGGLAGNGRFNNIPISVEAYPMIDDRDVLKRQGGILLHIKAGAPVWLKCCTGPLVSLMGYPPQGEEQTLDMCQGCAEMAGDTLYLYSNKHPLYIGLKANAPFDVKEMSAADEVKEGYGLACFASGEVWLTAGFSDKKEEALKLAAQETAAGIEKVRGYYKEMLDNWYIKTPDENLDEAFMHARLNVEYAWFRPFGWVEALHHWISMWHMEHTAAEEWAGNYQRSREIFISQLERLLNGDEVPELSAPGFARKEWGGDNPYFFRGVEHYLKMTGDIEFARQAEPYMQKILAQTFKEYDPLKTGVMGFGTQLGNQEDFLATHGPGSGSGCEGAHMLRVMAMVENLLGNRKASEKYEQYARAVQQKVYDQFWMEDVGRFAWYRDALGQMRLEAPYHSVCYPILYNMLSDREKVSSIDHLLHRLSGPSGEMYISNLFGGHCYYAVSTWGMQCGGNMQYFAAASYARLGMNNQAVRPLKFIADIVSSRHRGAFPETANDADKAYFSPAACMYSQGIIEGIFGLDRNVPANKTTVSPCFPDNWEHAEIKLPGVNIKYCRKKDIHNFEIRLEDRTQKHFIWRLPPYSAITAEINGRPAQVTTHSRCGWFEAEISLGSEEFSSLQIQYTPVSFALEKPDCASVGSEYELKVKGAELIGLNDPAGVFRGVRLNKNAMNAQIGENLLKKYQSYGWVGLVNFARHTFFVTLKAEGVLFEYPVHLTVLPQYVLHALPLCGNSRTLDAEAFREAPGRLNGNDGSQSAANEKSILTLQIIDYTGRENTASKREVSLLLGGGTAKTTALFKKYEPVKIDFELNKSQLENLTPGRNKGALLIDGRREEFYMEYRPSGDMAFFIPLPEDKLKPALYWNEIGKNTSPGSTIYCITPENILQDVFDGCEVLENMPGVPFRINKKGFLPVSSRNERYASINLKGVEARKVYVLLSAFITNQHAFSQPFYMELEAESRGEYFPPVYGAQLSFPGNLDIGLSGRGNYGFPTYVEEQPRDVLPALPSREDADYPEAYPPGYPQHLLWNQFKAFQVGETVFSVIELDLEEKRPLKELRIWVQDSNAAMGIYALSAV